MKFDLKTELFRQSYVTGRHCFVGFCCFFIVVSFSLFIVFILFYFNYYVDLLIRFRIFLLLSASVHT